MGGTSTEPATPQLTVTRTGSATVWGSIDSATTAARGVGRASRESADVARAQENVAALEARLSELQSALEADLQATAADWDPSADTLERVVIKPKRGGVAVQLVALVWLTGTP